jgi:putative transposase
MLTDSIDRAMKRHRYAVIAFVYMPEHVHLLVFPQKSASLIEELLPAIKRPFSYRVKSALAKIQSPLLERFTIRQRPGVDAFRFWQEGPGYDRNLISLETALAAATYIHLNPVRRGLVERELDWRWSSIRHHVESSLDPDPGLPLICPLSEVFIP